MPDYDDDDDVEYLDACAAGFYEYDYPLTFPCDYYPLFKRLQGLQEYLAFHSHQAASVYNYNTQTFTTYRIEQ